MSWKKVLAKIFVCMVLEVGVLSGAPIRREEIEQLMQMSEPCVVQTLAADPPEEPEELIE